MLFHSSLRKEMARSFGATLVVLATVIMTMTLIRLLGQASVGRFNPSDVSLIMGYTVLAYMPTILTMSLFIACVSALTRMYRDSEMVIWFSSGLGLGSFLLPALRFAWPVFLVIVSLSCVVLPWSNQQIEDMKSTYERRGDLDRIEPGRFQESASGNRVFFIDKETADAKTGSNVFIASTDAGKETVTSARKGRIEWIDQDQFLMLESGQRLERDTANATLKISEFSSYGTLVKSAPLSADDMQLVNTIPTLRLMKSDNLRHQGELSWRFGMVLAAINFVILAIAISQSAPRAGRGASLGFSMATFVVYFNLLGLGQNWIASGKVQWEIWMVGLHGGAFALALAWLAWRHHQWRLFDFLRSARQTGKAVKS